MIYKNSYELILNHSIYVSKQTRRMKATREEKEASVFLQKNIQSALTLYYIYNPIRNHIFPAMADGGVIFDFASANTIARSMFEAYVNMYYLLLDKVTDEERNFRLDRWEKHSLTERKLIAKSLGSKNPKLIIEEKEIIKFEKRIYESTFFKSLPKNEQQSIRNSYKWTKLDAIEKADLAGIDRSQSEYLYKILSNYTHSESFSIMQLHSIENQLEAKKLCKLSIRFGEMYLTLTLAGFGSLNQKALELIYQNEQVVELIKFWNQLKPKRLSELKRST